MLRLAIGALPFNALETRRVEFRCKCSYERVVRIVTALGREEVEDMLEKDKGAELTCHFCNSVYYLDEDALRGILEPPPPVVM
jgi:molecular chaperone Hsp33